MTSNRGIPDLWFPTSECRSCRTLWAAEAYPGSVANPSQSYASVMHPDCLEHPCGVDRRVSLASLAEGASIRVPHGPLLGYQVIEDPDAGLWSSVVVLTAPSGTRGYPAIVAGGVATTAGDALTLGWIEALERRCSLRRPRERLVFASQPSGSAPAPRADGRPTWWTEAHTLDNATVSIPLEETILASQWRGTTPSTTDSTGMSVHTSREAAIFHGLRECVERTALHQWWTRQGSRRCSPHSLVATDLLRASALALPHSTCETWHLQLGEWHAAGCVIFTQGRERLAAAYGAGAARSADAAVHAAWREAFQMHTAPELSMTGDGRIVFGTADGHTMVEDDFRERLLMDFPAQTYCTELGVPAVADSTEQGTVQSLLEVVDGPVLIVDAGDELTDALELHVLRVVCPELCRFTPDTYTPSGLTPVFLGA
jgi:ribosomal protein S12 methylthiotransferase accessory factor YcaO